MKYYFDIISSDFNEVLKKLSEKYSREIIREAADLGMVALALCEMKKAYPEKWDTSNESSHMEDWTINQINSELAAADKYYQKWRDSNNIQFKQIGMDELRHAEILIKQAREQGIPEAEILPTEQKHRELSQRLR